MELFLQSLIGIAALIGGAYNVFMWAEEGNHVDLMIGSALFFFGGLLVLFVLFPVHGGQG